MADHDKLLSGRVKARFGLEARHRAAQSLTAAMSQALTAAAAEVDRSGDNGPLEEAMDAYRLLRALQLELSGMADQM